MNVFAGVFAHELIWWHKCAKTFRLKNTDLSMHFMVICIMNLVLCRIYLNIYLQNQFEPKILLFQLYIHSSWQLILYRISSNVTIVYEFHVILEKISDSRILIWWNHKNYKQNFRCVREWEYLDSIDEEYWCATSIIIAMWKLFFDLLLPFDLSLTWLW